MTPEKLYEMLSNMAIDRILWFLLAALIVMIFVFSGEGFYRYPCQDPRNWETPECTPPICTQLRMCSSDLTGGQDAQN